METLDQLGRESSWLGLALGRLDPASNEFPMGEDLSAEGAEEAEQAFLQLDGPAYASASMVFPSFAVLPLSPEQLELIHDRFNHFRKGCSVRQVRVSNALTRAHELLQASGLVIAGDSSLRLQPSSALRGAGSSPVNKLNKQLLDAVDTTTKRSAQLVTSLDQSASRLAEALALAKVYNSDLNELSGWIDKAEATLGTLTPGNESIAIPEDEALQQQLKMSLKVSSLYCKPKQWSSSFATQNISRSFFHFYFR